MPIYMKVPKVTGTGKGKYLGWIELESAQVGTSRHVTNSTGQGVNREASAPATSEIVVTKVLDTASSDLFRLSLWGEPTKVTIDFVREDSKNTVPYLSLELEGVLISNYSVSGSGGPADKARETLVLSVTKITYSTKQVEGTKDSKPDRMAWDLATAKGG